MSGTLEDVPSELQTPVRGVGTAPPLALGVLLAVLLVAVNLRVPITSVGALIDLIRDAGLSAGASAFLTTLPVLCFAVVGALGMGVARRLGAHRGLAVALVLLIVGLVVRVLDGPVVLLTGTFVACGGIALANVLLPAVVKEHFPSRVGLVTGAYSAVLSLGAAGGAAVSVPLAEATGGWRGGLLAWSVLAVVALVVWVPFCRNRGRVRGGSARRSLLREPVAWAVTVVFAIQSVCAYVVMSWLPSIYVDAGFSHATAGLLLAVSILVGVPVFLVVPSMAARSRSQGTLIAVLSLLLAAGFLGLWLAPVAGAWAWAVLLGVGGGVFPVTLTLFALRTDSPEDTAALSAMAQSFGYGLAAAGPFLVGLLREVTGGWGLPLALLVVACLVQTQVGRVAGRPVVLRGQVRSEARRRT